VRAPEFFAHRCDNLRMVFILFALLIRAHCADASDDRKSLDSFEISITSRTGYFPSPVYAVSIRGNGKVTYHGYDKVRWKGTRRAKAAPEAIQRILDEVRASKFLDLPGSYENGPCLAMDGSEGSLRVRLDGREKSVGTCNAPPIVDQLTNEVDSAARVWRWLVCDPDELRLKIAHGWSVSGSGPDLMQSAIAWDAGELIRILIGAGLDVDKTSEDRITFLRNAVTSGSVQAASTLLDLGADWRIEGSEDTDNAATAAGWRTPEMIKAFLSRGISLSTISKSGRTMLMNAAALPNRTNMKFLIDSGADVNIRAKDGQTALAIAEKARKDHWHGSPETDRQSQEIIDYLIQHGAIR
jgi:hypothetical protein